MSRRLSILSVGVDALTQAQVLERLSNVVAAKLPTQIVTVNPEFLVRAQHDPAFRRVLQNAELALPDGIGIRAAATFQSFPVPAWQPARLLVSIVQGLWTGTLLLVNARRLRTPLPETVTGVDLIEQLARRCQQEGWRFFFLGGERGAGERAAAALREQFPGLVIVGSEEGLTRQEFEDPARRAQVAARIGQLRPDVLLVAFGAPKQDLFIAEQRDRLNVPVMIGVGGAFDFMSGAVSRAPKAMRDLGLEWLWRFANQPWRWHRIWNAVVVFPWLVFWNRQVRRVK